MDQKKLSDIFQLYDLSHIKEKMTQGEKVAHSIFVVVFSSFEEKNKFFWNCPNIHDDCGDDIHQPISSTAFVDYLSTLEPRILITYDASETELLDNFLQPYNHAKLAAKDFFSRIPSRIPPIPAPFRTGP